MVKLSNRLKNMEKMKVMISNFKRNMEIQNSMISMMSNMKLTRESQFLNSIDPFTIKKYWMVLSLKKRVKYLIRKT